MRERNESVLAFWARNLGIGVVLLPVGLMRLWKQRAADGFALHFYAPLVALFLVTNAYVFQPHAFDNMKFMLYTYLGLALVGGWITAGWLRRGALPALAAGAVLFSLGGAGALSIAHEPRIAWPLLSAEDLELAHEFAKLVPPEARVLTSPKHNHFVPTLTGRRIVMGYRGWLWTYGIDTRRRERDVLTMFGGARRRYASCVPTMCRSW